MIAEYPDSPFVLDAKSQLLLTFFNEGKYQETIDRAVDVLKTTDSKTFALNTYLLIGDSYLAIGSFAEALDAYLAAFSHLDDKKEESVIVKIETASNGIDAKAIIDLLFRYEGVIPVQGLIYRLGLSKFKVKKYEDAKNLLSEAMKRYPKHKNYQKSKELIGEIDKTFIFRRHTLGCLLPLSGPYKVYGDMMLRCIELALARFASQNDNPQIKLIIKDTESDSDKAVLAVKELSNERVGAILGPVSASEAAALQAQRERIPIITFSQKEDITDMGDYVFRNFITPKSQIKTLVSYAMDNLGLTRYAILHPDDKYGILFKSLFQQEVDTYGGEIVGVESYQAGQTDFAEIIKKISGLNRETLENSEKREHRSVVKPMDLVLDFEAIFIPDGPSTSGLIIPQLAFYDVVDVKLLGTNIWHSNRLIEMAQQFVQNAIMVDGFFAESQSQQVKDFVGNFESAFNETPGFIEAVAYDTAMMLFQLISRKDIQSRIELKNELMNLQNFDGVTGITSFDVSGDAQKDLYILQIEGDTFVEAEVFPAAEPLE